MWGLRNGLWGRKWGVRDGKVGSAEKGTGKQELEFWDDCWGSGDGGQVFGWAFWNDGLLWMARQVANVLDFWISSWINAVLAKSLSRASEFWNSTTRLLNMEFWNNYALELWNRKL